MICDFAKMQVMVSDFAKMQVMMCDIQNRKPWFAILMGICENLKESRILLYIFDNFWVLFI